MEELIETFELFDDWTEKYGHIIDLGKKLKPMPDALKTDANKVSGCLSQVWFHHEIDADGLVQFLADSDAIIVRGLIGLLLTIYNGQSPEAIREIDIDALMERIGLSNHLSPNRRNGFVSMINRIRMTAE